MPDGVPGHRPDFPFIERVVDRGPVYRAGLSLHDPEILAFESASQIVGEAVSGGIEVPLSDIVIPGGEVEVFLDHVVIEAVKPAHRVRGDELLGIGIGANDLQLVLLVTAPGIADESLPGQQQSGIAVLRLNRNLAPVENCFAPVGGSPACIQVVESDVTRLEP